MVGWNHPQQKYLHHESQDVLWQAFPQRARVPVHHFPQVSDQYQLRREPFMTAASQALLLLRFRRWVMPSSVTSWTVARQAPLSSFISWSVLIFMSTESEMLSNHLIHSYPLLLLPSIFPSIKVFSNELDLPIRWPKYWTSASASYTRWIFRVDFL